MALNVLYICMCIAIFYKLCYCGCSVYKTGFSVEFRISNRPAAQETWDHAKHFEKNLLSRERCKVCTFSIDKAYAYRFCSTCLWQLHSKRLPQGAKGLPPSTPYTVTHVRVHGSSGIYRSVSPLLRELHSKTKQEPKKTQIKRTLQRKVVYFSAQTLYTIVWYVLTVSLAAPVGVAPIVVAHRVSGVTNETVVFGAFEAGAHQLYQARQVI